MTLVDLSIPISEFMPVYPGDPATKIEPKGTLQKDGFEDHYLSIGTHAGTHIDAPSHMILNGKTLDQIPLVTFLGRGVYIKIQNKRFDMQAITSIRIQEGDIVLFHTGMSDRYTEKDYFQEYPAFPEELANYLVQKKVKIVGVDMGNIDHDTFSVHKIFLQNEILILENLTNLSLLENKQFTIYAFPLKLSLDGSPVRVIADVKE